MIRWRDSPIYGSWCHEWIRKIVWHKDGFDPDGKIKPYHMEDMKFNHGDVYWKRALLINWRDENILELDLNRLTW